MSPTAEPAALFTREGAIGLITLNRPAALNAVNRELTEIVGDALAECDADQKIRALVIHGNGRAFCAGGDLKEKAAGGSNLPSGKERRGFAGIVRHHISTPMIAAVNGMAFGGGVEIVLACDLAVAAETATFAMPEVKRGIIAGAGGLVRLAGQVPEKVALAMLLIGEPIDAATALRWGLVNDLRPEPEVLPAAMDLAGRISANAPLAVQASKRVLRGLRDGISDTERDAWHRNDRENNLIRQSLDAREGPRAFAEKRDPVWQGR